MVPALRSESVVIRFLRWHYPDQVRRSVAACWLPSQPESSGPRAIHQLLEYYPILPEAR